MMKKCMPLWREAHVQLKMYKAHHVRTTFGSCDVEKVHADAVVARSTCRGQHVKHTTCSDHFWTFRCRVAWQARNWGPCQKWAKGEGFVAFPKSMAGVAHLKRIWQDAFSVAGAVQETCSLFRDVRRSGRWFPERGCFLEHQIFSCGNMLLRDSCSTSYDLASRFPGRRNTLDRRSGKTEKPNGTRPSALHSTSISDGCLMMSHRIASFLMLSSSKLRKSHRIASFLMVSSSKIKEISQHCCVFDDVKFKNWGSLTE